MFAVGAAASGAGDGAGWEVGVSGAGVAIVNTASLDHGVPYGAGVGWTLAGAGAGIEPKSGWLVRSGIPSIMFCAGAWALPINSAASSGQNVGSNGLSMMAPHYGPVCV